MASFGDVVVEDTAHGPGITGNRHWMIRIDFLLFDAFGSQPLFVAIVLTGTVAARFVGVFAQTKVGDDEPITADADQNVGRADVAVDVLFLVNERQAKSQLVESKPIRRDRQRFVFGICSPIFEIAGAQLESEIPAGIMIGLIEK